MENVQGGKFSVASFICGVGFAGYWGIIEYGLVAGGVVTGGVTTALGLGVALVGACVCSLA